MDDTIQSLVRANDLKNGNQEIDISKTNILPTIEIEDLADSPQTKKVMKEQGVDLEELGKYVDIVIVLQEHRDGDKSTYYQYGIKQCQLQDFEKRGY